MYRFLTFVSLLTLSLATGCDEEQPSETTAKTSKPAANKSGAAATAKPSAEAKGTTKGRDGSWAIEAPGRGKAYDVASKGGKVTLNMGGTVFEGKDDERGRRYTTTSGGDYLLEKKGDGFELAVEGKPTWSLAFEGDGLKLSSDGTEIRIAKAGDTFEIKKGDDLLGKVVTDGDQVVVQDAKGTTKYKGKDGLVAGWGVLILEDVHPVARRILLAELLARG